MATTSSVRFSTLIHERARSKYAQTETARQCCATTIGPRSSIASATIPSPIWNGATTLPRGPSRGRGNDSAARVQQDRDRRDYTDTITVKESVQDRGGRGSGGSGNSRFD